MLSDKSADVVSHAPEHEAEQLRRHPTWFYRKVLYNDFLIVGPSIDPAGVVGVPDAATALNVLRIPISGFCRAVTNRALMNGNSSSGARQDSRPVCPQPLSLVRGWDRHSESPTRSRRGTP